MSAPRILKELQVATELLQEREGELTEMQLIAERTTTTGRDIDTVAEPVIERVLEYVSNLDDSQLDELHEMYVIRSGDEE